MRYLSILLIWIVAYTAPIYAGDWWEAHFHLYQSAISLLLMASVLYLTDEWWRAEYATLCALQILHNLGDFIFDFPVSNYNHIQTVLNTLEIAVILLAGGLTQLYRVTYGRAAATRGGGRGRDDAESRASSGRRHA